MAPEQVLAEEIDGRADLYAMGVVLYRLLTSQLPFKADSGISMAHKQVHDAPTPVRAVRMELPPACENIIGRALAKSPADRFQTADEFKAALGALSVTGSGNSIAVPGSGSAPRVPEEPTVMLKMPARKQLSLAVLIGAVVLAGMPTAYLVWRSRPAQPQPSTVQPPIASAPAFAPAPALAISAPLLPTATTPAAATKTPSSSSTGDASSRSGSSGDAADPSPSRPSLPSISFSQIKLLQLNDEKPRDRDVLITFSSEALAVLDGPNLVERAPYHDVIGLFHSHSREPRWAKPDGTAVPLAKIGGKFAFLKGASDWITVQTRVAFIPLHVPESELARLVSELETRTGTHVVRTR
jgi:serine/threonine protein kinase